MYEMQNPDGSEKSSEQLWSEQIVEEGGNVDDYLADLRKELEGADEEDRPWLESAIETLERMKRS